MDSMDREMTEAGPLGADEPLLAAHVGANWERYYRPRFERLAAGDPAWMWNHAAAFVPFWMSFRRLDVALAVYLAQLVAVVATIIATRDVLGGDGAWALGLTLPVGIIGALQGGFGTSMVWRAARRVVANARRRHPPWSRTPTITTPPTVRCSSPTSGT
jgi:hypothetical protein